MSKTFLLLLVPALLAGCATAPSTPLRPASAPTAAACPKELPAGAKCFTGEDAGAFYWIALPEHWQPARGVLFVHAHGGPADTGPAKAERSLEDLQRWAVTVKAGYAWVGSTYRRGGYGVTMAAEDTERVRQVFVQHFGKPRRAVLHGQSYGGNVAAKAAELYDSSWDGVLLTSGVLGGGLRSYDFRLDLRAVYQHICGNHPRPGEPQYPLWMGLPRDSRLTHAELAARIDECTGVRRPATQRTPQQQANLAAVTRVIHIPEKSLVGHMNWATWLFRDMTQLRLDNRNPFTNAGVQYRGSADDVALNAGVPRYAADSGAVEALARDSAPMGTTRLPTLTLHAIDDPTAFVELESFYRDVRRKAGTDDMLVQVFSDEAEHSYLGEPQYPALFTALLDWIDRNDKPNPQKVLDLCRSYQATYEGACRIRPGYEPQPLSARVPAR